MKPSPSKRPQGRVHESRSWFTDRSRRRPSKGSVNFVITQLPHEEHRYETVGDWIPGSPVEIRVSRMNDERYVFLVALHEMIEYELCKMKGISDAEVVAFDTTFELERNQGLHDRHDEPGDDGRAPYGSEHGFATTIEKLVAQRLGVRWSDYEETITSLARPSTVKESNLVRSGLHRGGSSLRSD
jgi:hypothetical protein